MKTTSRGILLAVLAATLYAIGSPLSKYLLSELPPTFMAGFLYVGAGIGMAAVLPLRHLWVSRTQKRSEEGTLADSPSAQDRVSLCSPYTLGMILLDILAPICLMNGLMSIPASGASLLNNFEIVATALIAFTLFREPISPRLWGGILLITLACALLSVEDLGQLRLSWGAIWVLLASLCWGLENNCTRKLSEKDPLQIVLLKGIFSGLGSCTVALCLGERITQWAYVPLAIAVGMVAYGFSIFAYVYAQREIGAARTSAYYAVAPFIGTVLSMIFLREWPSATFYLALAVMAVGAWLAR